MFWYDLHWNAFVTTAGSNSFRLELAYIICFSPNNLCDILIQLEFSCVTRIILFFHFHSLVQSSSITEHLRFTLRHCENGSTDISTQESVNNFNWQSMGWFIAMWIEQLVNIRQPAPQQPSVTFLLLNKFNIEVVFASNATVSTPLAYGCVEAPYHFRWKVNNIHWRN